MKKNYENDESTERKKHTSNVEIKSGFSQCHKIASDNAMHPIAFRSIRQYAFQLNFECASRKFEKSKQMISNKK